MPSYRFKCRNPRCGSEFHRHFTVEEFDRNQYGTQSGWACFNCGYIRMAVIKSNKAAQDGFKPGFQKNIRRYAGTYSEYKKILKEMGLIEIGHEEIPEPEEGKPMNYWTPDIVKKVVQSGVELSGNEIKALEAGKLNEMPDI